jgi:hypothetical protein
MTNTVILKMTSLHFYSFVEHPLEAQIANFGKKNALKWPSLPAIIAFDTAMVHFCPKTIM